MISSKNIKSETRQPWLAFFRVLYPVRTGICKWYRQLFTTRLHQRRRLKVNKHSYIACEKHTISVLNGQKFQHLHTFTFFYIPVIFYDSKIKFKFLWYRAHILSSSSPTKNHEDAIQVFFSQIGISRVSLFPSSNLNLYF